MKKIVLAGNAVTAEVLNGYLEQDSRYKVVAATVDDEFLTSGGLPGLRSIGLGALPASYSPDEVSIVMAAGYSDLNRSRESLFGRLKALGYAIETYVHPDARVYSRHPLGEGCVVLPGAVVDQQVRVGANSLVWCNSTLAHHCAIGDHCWIASGSVISGQAVVDRNTFVGVNATVVNKVHIGAYNVIGGGALITKDTKPHSVHLARSAEELRYSADDYAKYFGV